jgi:hypothetical protein
MSDDDRHDEMNAPDEPRPGDAGRTDVQSLAAMPRGARVVLRGERIGEHEGVVVRATSLVIALLIDGKERVIPLGAIDSFVTDAPLPRLAPPSAPAIEVDAEDAITPAAEALPDEGSAGATAPDDAAQHALPPLTTYEKPRDIVGPPARRAAQPMGDEPVLRAGHTYIRLGDADQQPNPATPKAPDIVRPATIGTKILRGALLVALADAVFLRGRLLGPFAPFEWMFVLFVGIPVAAGYDGGQENVSRRNRVAKVMAKIAGALVVVALLLFGACLLMIGALGKI